ncbi:MAG TPA: protein translocase subunit SecF [candidate division WWE3 bacterium]|uniref:Protein-export membrane protein SecF n=1 Tax=candidate division WWE3 bacterium TaxID=2053526 RepID=A0A7C1NYC8_UNCKA|nr:protein translocase subunit SecF [candidate division WWE3 bacterium]
MINFMKYRLIYFLISALVIVPGVISLAFFGFSPSIDFTGGTLWEVQFADSRKPEAGSKIRESFEDAGLDAEVQSSGENQFLIKTSPLDSDSRDLLENRLESSVGEFEEVRFETLGPRLGEELLRKALFAVLVAILVILLYIAYRFKHFAYGAVAILAMLHDSVVLLGVFSLLGHFFDIKVDTLFVTAVLTTLSFSAHDTIVVFDRIREILKKTNLDFESAVNQAVGETLVRSINNSLTIIFMLVALFVLGGETLKWFVFALLVGTVSGTYSSTFTAAPLLIVWFNLSTRGNWRGILRLH